MTLPPRSERFFAHPPLLFSHCKQAVGRIVGQGDADDSCNEIKAILTPAPTLVKQRLLNNEVTV
jgi:hypothetical protein